MFSDSFAAVLAAAVTAGASLTAVAVGLRQVTDGARLRNLEELLRNARKEGQEDSAQWAVLDSVHTETLGRILARQAIPGWLFWAPSLWVAFACLLVVQGGRAPWPGSVLVTLHAWSILIATLGLRALIRLTLERVRVARSFQRGATPIRAFRSVMTLAELGRPGGYLVALSGAAGIVGLCASAVRLVPTAPSGDEGLLNLVLLSVSAIAAAYVLMARAMRGVAREPRHEDGLLVSTWVHPLDDAAPPNAD